MLLCPVQVECCNDAMVAADWWDDCGETLTAVATREMGTDPAPVLDFQSWSGSGSGSWSGSWSRSGSGSRSG